MVDVIGTKRCSYCKSELSLSAFSPYAASKDGHRGQCKPCRAAYQLAYSGRRPRPSSPLEEGAAGEVWRGVPGYEDLYQISSIGRIRRIATGKGTRVGRLLNQSIDDGYASVHLFKDGCTKVLRINRLVAMAFIGPAPTETHEAAHNDGNRGNNSALNIRWATPQENVDDQIVHGTRTLNRGSRPSLTSQDMERVRELKRSGQGLRRLAQTFQVRVSTIRSICRRRPCPGQAPSTPRAS